MLLDTAVSIPEKLSTDNIQEVRENITQTSAHKEVLKCVSLAMDVVAHPANNRDFGVIGDDSGPKFGKRDTFHRLESGLKKAAVSGRSDHYWKRPKSL
jgi:hypothetical protein